MNADARLEHPRVARLGIVWLFPVLAVCLCAPLVSRAEIGPHGPNVDVSQPAAVPHPNDLGCYAGARPVAYSASGFFVVAYYCDFFASPKGIYFRRFDTDGNPLGPQTHVSTVSTPQDAPTVAADAAGNFVIAWGAPDAGSGSIFAQRFDSSGTPVGAEIRVNALTGLSDAFPVVAKRADGSFIVVWRRTNPGTEADVYFRIISGSGVPGSEEVRAHIQSNGLQQRPQVSVFSDGSFLIAWQGEQQPGDMSDNAVVIRRFDSGGGFLTDDLLVNDQITSGYQGEPQIAAGSDGRLLITWTSLAAEAGDDGLGDVRAQRFRPDGERDGSEFRINENPIGIQGTASASFLSGNHFLVAFIDGVKAVAQKLRPTGTRDGLQFNISDKNLLGETHANLSLVRMSGDLSVAAFNLFGTGKIEARVLGPVVNPVINTPPQSQTVCSGSDATFTVSAGGSNLSYQWLYGGSPLDDGPKISGSKTDTLTLSGVGPSFGGTYSVIVYEAPPVWGETVSPSAELTVSVVPTALVTGGAQLCAGESTTIQAALTGTGPFSILWSDGLQQNNVTASPVVRTVTPGSTTVYTITTIQNATCTGTSSGSATVTVNPVPTGVVSGSTTICGGGSANLSVSLTGTGPWDLTWSDGFLQTSATSPAVRSVTPAFTTTYTVTALSDSTCTGSATGSATVTLSPTASVSGSRMICSGSSAQIQAALTGISPWTVTWSDGFVQPAVATSPATRTVSPGATTIYTVTSVTDAVCTGVSQGSAVITVEYPPTPATVGGPQSICARTATAPLGGNTPVSGVGQWKVVSGGTGTFLPDAATPGARFQHNQGSGPVVLRWTITSAACNQSSSADVAITILPSPSTTITAPESVCAGATGQTASVSNTPGTTFFWRVLGGGTLVSGQGTPNITWNAPVSGTVTLEVTSNNGTCFATGTRAVAITQSAAVPAAVKPLQAAAGYAENSLEWTPQPYGRYRVLFDTVNPPQRILADDVTANTAAIPVLFPSTTYYWQVRATNPCGSSTSPVYFFVSGPCPWTITPSHTLSPALATLDVPKETDLEWSAVPGASHYDIRLSTSPVTAQTPVFRSVMAPSTSVAVALNPGTTYYWNVTAVPGCGSAAASVSLESWFQVASSGFSLASVSPSQHFRYGSTVLSAAGAGIGDGMSLAPSLDGRSAGPFTVSTLTPSTVTGTLGPDLSAPAGRYDVGLTLWGSEVARLPGALSVRAFRDVSDTGFYFLSSSRMADAGIMEADFSPGDGIPDFAPATQVTRALMAEYLARAYQWWRTRSTALAPATCIPAGAGSTDFPDVPCAHPQWLAIHWIKTWGITIGATCDQGFCYLPANTLTRGEMATFLERLRQGTLLPTLLSTVGEIDPGCSEPWPACSGWTDPGMQTAGWPRREVNVAFADRMTAGCAGTVGNGLTMCVGNPLTRGEIGEFLARAIGLVPTP
ncbi:MAG: immunoglobulin domain-containing protein [Acidobacteria bacterium]|nr:immunoglobulin domain-containing protein [Acidobacteriota bacterium]